MNILEITSECIWWILHFTVKGLLAFLDLNYLIVAFALHITKIIAEITVEFTSNLFDILKCYFNDFVTFSNELALGLSFILHLVTNFLSRTVAQLSYILCYIVDSINHILMKIVTTSKTTVDLLIDIFNYILYFLTVIFHAILILLQLGPNLLIFLYESTRHCCEQGWNMLQFASYLLWENLHLLPHEFQKIIGNVPLKAYFGLMLLISLYHARTILQKHLENLCMFVVDCCVALWFEIFPKTIVNLILFYKKCKKYVFSKETESNGAPATTSDTKGLRKKIVIVLQYFQSTLNFLKVPISKVNEELSEHQLQELKKKLHAEKERRICIICHDRERSVLLYPCRHMCMCEECTRAVQAAYQGCPLCRQDILDTMKVYT